MSCGIPSSGSCGHYVIPEHSCSLGYRIGTRRNESSCSVIRPHEKNVIKPDILRQKHSCTITCGQGITRSSAMRNYSASCGRDAPGTCGGSTGGRWALDDITDDWER